MKYFTEIQRAFQTLFLSSIIVDTNLFSIRNSDIQKTIEELVSERKNNFLSYFTNESIY